MTEKASDSRYDYEIPTEEETPRQNVVKASDAKYDYELPADAAAGDEAPKSEYLGKPPGYEPKTTAAPYPAGFPVFGGADPNDARPIKRADQIRAERAASAGQAAPAPPSAWQAAKAAVLSPFGVPPEEQAPGLRAAMQATPWTSGAATAADIVEKGVPAAAESFTASQFPLTGKVVAPLAGKVARGLATAATNPIGAAAAGLALTPAAPFVGGAIAVKSGWDAASRDFPDLVEGVMTGDLEKVTDAGANLVQDALGVGGGGFLARGARGPARAAAATEATARPAPGGGTPARPGGPGLAAELRQLAPQDYTVAKGVLDDAVAATAAKHVEAAAAEGHLTRADLDAATSGVRPAEVAALERGADAAEARSGGAPAAEAGGEGGLARQGEKLVQTLTEEKPPSGNPILDSILKELENANAETVTPAAAPAAEGAGRPTASVSGSSGPLAASWGAGAGATSAAPEGAEVGAGGPPVGPGQEKVQGEAPLDMRAQEQALLAGARQAILFHKAGPGPDSAFPPFGIERVMTPAGEIWFRTDAGLTMDRVKEMAQSVEGLGKLLEMPAGRPKGENPKAVSVIDQDGNEVWSAEIDDKTRQATLKRATAMAEKIGGVVTETTRKQVVAGRQERVKEQEKIPLPPGPQHPRPFEQGETVLYIPLSGKEKEGVIGSVLDNGKFRVVDRQGMASIVGPEKMRRPEAAKPQTEAAPAPPIVGKRPFETPTDIRRFNDALRSHVPEGQRMDEGVGTTSDNKLVFKLDDGNLYKVTLSKNEFGRTQAELERVPEGDVVGYSEGQSPSEQMRSQAINAPPAPAKKPKKAKAAPAVDMNRQAVANHLKVTVGSGWEEELVGLDRAAQDFEAKEGRSKAEFWKELANDTIGAAPAPAPIHKPVEAPKVETGDLGKVVTGPDDVAITAEGEEIPYTWAFVNVHKLIPSHDSAGNPNPGYARAGETIQNRDRASEDSVAQMSSIKSNPDPRRLAYAPSATDGAPIIRPDGRALTNGRTAGLQAAFKEGNAAKYRAGIAAEARRTGMSEEAIAEGMKDPESVLVRLAKAEYINKTDQTRLARDTNVGVGLRMSITEQGRSDAAVMMSPGSVDETTRVLALIPEDGNGDIRSSAYLPFAQAFAKAFVPANERAGLFDKGSLTNEGALRVQAALVAAAYGDSKVVDRFLTSDAGAGNPLRKAVLAVAPDFATVNMQQQHGELEAFDVTPPLVDAAEFIVDMQASGKTLEQTLRPTGKTGSGKKLQAPELIKATDRLSPEGLDIINILDQYARTPAKASKLLIGIFRELAKVAQQLKISRDQGGLFGEGEIEKVPVPKISEAWKIAKENYEEQQRGKGLLEDEDAEPVGAEAEGAGTATLEGAGEGGTAPDKGKTPPPDDQLREEPAAYGQPAVAQPTFFSALSRAVDAIPFKSIPAADLYARLTKTPGVKKEELEWVGLPAAFEEWHKGIVAQRRGDVESDKWWQIHITPAMRESVLAGQPLFEKPTKYDPRQKGLFDDGDTGSLRKPAGEEGTRAADGRADEGVLPAASAEGADRDGLGLSRKSSRFTLGQLAARNREAQERGTATVEKLLADLRASVPGGVDPDNDPLVVTASKIAKTFRRGEFVSLVGYDVPDAKALGVVAQIAANPAYETLRIALLDDDNVLVQEIPVSCHLPAGVMTNHIDMTPDMVAAEMKRYGATKWALIHNHPGGDATPSGGDRRVTVAWADRVPGFIGHVVIDHNTYSIIKADGSYSVQQLDEKAKALRPKLWEDPDESEAAKHLGIICNGSEDLAKLGISMHTQERSVLLVFANRIGDDLGGRNRIRALATVPYEKAIDYAWMTRRIRYEQGFHGAQNVMAYSSGKGLTVPEAIELASTMQDLYLVDAEGGVTLSDFLLGSDPRLSYFNQFPRGHGDPGPSQGFMGPVKPVRLAEAPAYYGENDPYEADGRSPREQAFDRWFEGSKVVNEDGSPKVVYHGTHSEHDFDAFWTQGYKVDLGAHFGTPGQANDIIGTRDLIKPGAPTYMPGTTKAMQAVRASSLKRIYPVYLSIKNPLRLPDLGGWVRPRSYIVTIPPGAKGVEGELRKLAVETEEKFEAGDVGVIEDFPGQVKQLLEDMGYDGIVYVNENEAFDEEADSYIAFHPWQIKSATGNKGTFDPANKSILHEGDTDYGVPPMREKGIPADAPHVALARNTQALQGDPDYKEAKAGDREAAVRLVNRLVTPEAVARAKAFGKDVTYVFPHAEEAAGRNAIPGLVATKLAVETGGGLDEEIIQANRVHHTGANAKQRFVARPTFEGPVQKGARYVIVDDVTTFGNTLAELANHIQKNGGEVAGTFVLADASRTPTLAPERRRVDALETRLGDALRATLGLDPAALTRPEVDYFLGFKSPESLRTTVATARQERADRLRSKSVLPPDEVAEEGSSYGSPDREKNLQKWAGKTVVRNKDGSLKRVYHGTVSEFDIFSQKKASVESDLGAGFYFTSNPDDASVNYGSDKGADLENKVEHLAERIQGEMLDAGEEGDTEALMNLARDKAREQLGVRHGGAVLPVYLRIEKPLVLGGPGEPYWGYEYDEENDSDKGELTDLFEAMRVVRNGIEADGGDVGRDEYDRNLQKLYDYAGNKASKLLAIVKDAFVYAGDENGNLISGEAVRRVVEKMGYDGIVDHTVDIKFGTRSPASKYGKAMHGVTGDTVHYIVFSPNQIKSATGNRGTFSRRSASLIKEEDSSYGKKKSALDYASRFAPGAARALKPRGPEDEIRLAATDPAAGVFSAIFASRAPKASKTSQLPSPLDSHDPKVEARLRAAEGIVAPSILARVKQSFVDLEHSFTRHFIELDTKESKTIAADTDILRQLEASPDYAKSVALDTISYIADGLDKPAMRLFTRILALRDLHRSIDEGLYEDKDELPFGYEDKAAVTYDLRKYEAMAKEDEAVAGALAKREKYASELTQKLVDMELLPEDVLEDDRYYHRQVMAVFNQKQAAYVGTGSQDVRVHRKGFQKARTGGGDFNMRYQEAEFEWMAQAHSQIAMQEALDRLREANDIKPALERNAKWQNTLAIYGGIENYQRVQALKAEKAEIYTSAGLVLESDEKKRIAAINAELEEIDPLKPFTDRMGWSIHDLGKRAEEGELDHAPDWLQEAVDELRASSEWEEFRGDSESELFFPLLNYLVSAGKGGSKEAAYILKAVADKKKFIKEELGKDFKTWRDLIPDTHPLAPKSRAVVWQPEKGSIFYRAQTLPERALERFLEEIRSDESEAVDKEAVEALLGKASEALVKAGPKQEWVIPEGLAHTLDNWKGGGREKGFESTWVTLQQGWKQWVLLNPVRALRYTLNNESGDVDVVIAAFPGALRGWAQAARDLWKYTVKEDKSDTALVEEIQRATKLGVVSSGQSFQEIPDINEAGAFKGLTSDDPNVVQKTLETYWSGTKKFSTWRENTLRLAVFRYLEKELKAGAKLYGASRRHEVDAIKDTGERAAKIARELVGDYGNISVSGQYIRRHLIPFYSWMEINAPRYVRLLQNAAYEDRGGRRGGGGGDDERGGRGGRGGAAGRVAGVAAKKIAVNYAKLALFAPLLYGAIQAWNHLVFPEEEKLLAGNRKTLHLILGRNSDGSIRSIRLQGALSDALEIFGAGNVVSDVMDIASGKSTWRNKLNDALTSPIDKIVGGWEPFSKTLFELGFGYKSYPSLFKEGTTDLSPKKIRDLAEYAGDVVWPVGALYRKVTGRPRRPSPDMGIPWAGPLLDMLLVARTDPGEAAYWYSRNLAGKFLEAQGKTPSTGGPTGEAKDRADALYYFKRACEWGDDDAAGKWLAEYYELGGTPQKMNEAFVREHPLGGLPLGQRGAFVSSLSEEDRAVVQSAVEWYEKGRERMWTIAPQVPYTATYRKMAP